MISAPRYFKMFFLETNPYCPFDSGHPPPPSAVRRWRVRDLHSIFSCGLDGEELTYLIVRMFDL